MVGLISEGVPAYADSMHNETVVVTVVFQQTGSALFPAMSRRSTVFSFRCAIQEIRRQRISNCISGKRCFKSSAPATPVY
jgi:hypothetical protein